MCSSGRDSRRGLVMPSDWEMGMRAGPLPSESMAVPEALLQREPLAPPSAAHTAHDSSLISACTYTYSKGTLRCP